jgi:predicted Zn-ribbon and HTH transcriptional regulator
MDIGMKMKSANEPKLVCTDCSWSGYEDQLTTATGLIDESEVNHCPACRSDKVFDEEFVVYGI